MVSKGDLKEATGSTTKTKNSENGVPQRFDYAVVLQRLLIKDEFFASHKVFLSPKITTTKNFIAK
jgi:hypothetical protein